MGRVTSHDNHTGGEGGVAGREGGSKWVRIHRRMFIEWLVRGKCNGVRTCTIHAHRRASTIMIYTTLELQLVANGLSKA